MLPRPDSADVRGDRKVARQNTSMRQRRPDARSVVVATCLVISFSVASSWEAHSTGNTHPAPGKARTGKPKSHDDNCGLGGVRTAASSQSCVTVLSASSSKERGCNERACEGRTICRQRQQEFYGRIEYLLADLKISLTSALSPAFAALSKGPEMSICRDDAL